MSWYADEGRTQLLTTLTPPARYSLGKLAATTTYYDRCMVDGKPCEGSLTIQVSQKKGGRQAASPLSCRSSSVAYHCASSRPLAVDMRTFYTEMLCQLTNLIQTADDAQTVLSSLQQQLAGGE